MLSHRRSHAPNRFLMLPFTMALSLALLLTTACGGGGEKKPTNTESVSAKLRRVEVVSSTFSEMSLRVVIALNNPSQKDVQMRTGEVELSIAGKAKEIVDDEDEDEEEEVGGSDEETDATAEGEEEEAEEEEEEEEEEEDDGSNVDTSDIEGIVDGKWHKGTVEGVTIPAYAESEVAILLKLPLPADASALERMLTWQRMVVDVKGLVAAGGAQETFSGQRELGVPVFPQVLLQGAQISSTDGGKDGEAYLTLEVDNPNPFPIQVDQFAWGAVVGGKEMRKMGEPSREEVPPSSRLQSEATIRLDEETYGKEVRKLLREPSVPYVISGFYEVRGIRREFKFEGDMAFAR